MSRQRSHKVETWKRVGKVTVSRDEKGRFVRWERFKEEMPQYEGKKVAVYGYVMTRNGEGSRRYEFYGRGRDLYRAVGLACRFPPRDRFVTVSAEEFLRNPFRYGTSGYWIEKEVES